MYAANAYKQYQRTQITSANQKTLIVMLYGGAIKFINEAKIKLQKNDIAGKGKAIGKAMNIVNELLNSLDFQKGGEVAGKLSNLYFHVNQQLTEANFSNQIKNLDHVLNVLITLKDAWEKVPFRELKELKEAR